MPTPALGFARAWLRPGATPPESVERAGLVCDAYGGGGGQGTVVLVHGMNSRGRRDPRIVQLARALAGSGAEVLVPELPEVADLRIGRRSIDEVEGLIAATDGPLGLFAPSFSAGIALAAAGRPAVRGRVRSVLALGGFGDPERAIRFILEHPLPDPYARLILLRAFLPLIKGSRPDLEEALKVVLDDDGLQRAPPLQPEMEARLSPSARAELHELLRDPAPARRLASRIAEERAELIADLRPPMAGLTGTRVVLIHGRKDPVIPCEESVRLAAELRAGGVDTHLLLTSVVDHGTPTLGPRQAAELLRFGRALHHFLGPVTGP